MKKLINESKLILNHDNVSAKQQFVYWSVM